MEVEFKKGAFSYFLLAGLENNCTIYQRLCANSWVEQRNDIISNGCTTGVFQAAHHIASGHIGKKISLDCWHECLDLGFKG